MSETLLACGHAAQGTHEGVPVCVICGVTAQVAVPDLSGRMALCTDCRQTVPSDVKLAFFEYRGEGSRHATETCGNCRYHRVAHEPERRARNRNSLVCDNFVPAGAAEVDFFYSGCRGWD